MTVEAAFSEFLNLDACIWYTVENLLFIKSYLHSQAIRRYSSLSRFMPLASIYIS